MTKNATIVKVASARSPKGEMGQRYLASGVRLSMRLWKELEPTRKKPPRSRDYETVGYVLEGRAELHVGEQKAVLEPGDSWSVPAGVEHTYSVLQPFTAIEATSPPAEVKGRDPRPTGASR